MVERSHSMPPLNPWWSDRCKREALLRYARPEDLPVPHDGDDSDLLETQGDRVGGCGKGRGVSALEGGGNGLFVTPPSRREEEEDRGRGGGKRTHGAMPEMVREAKGRQPARTMGPMPPTPENPGSEVSKDQGERRAKEHHDGLQRALEAEMVTFLKEQNAVLMAEVAELRRLRASDGVSSTPSSWEQVGLKKKGTHVGHAEGHVPGQHVKVCGGDLPGTSTGVGVKPPHTPRGRSQSRRGHQEQGDVRFTPNGTQIPPGSPPRAATSMEVPMPPFPTSCTSAEISDLQGYELLDAHRRRHGDQQWLPLSLREGRVMMPLNAHELRASRLEQEVAELREKMALKLREVKKQGWQQFFWLLASRSAFWKLVFLADSSETKLPASKPYFLKRAASQKIKLLA